jgi:hypothetical protein
MVEGEEEKGGPRRGEEGDRGGETEKGEGGGNT